MDDLAREGLVLDFLGRFLADRDAGATRSLSTYLLDYPGIEEEVARHYLAFRDARTEGPKPPDTEPDQRGLAQAPLSTGDGPTSDAGGPSAPT